MQRECCTQNRQIERGRRRLRLPQRVKRVAHVLRIRSVEHSSPGANGWRSSGPTANDPGAWRHPASDLNDIFEPTRYEHIARVLEAARFDACFFADTFGLPDIHGGDFKVYLGLGGQISYLDPLSVLPLMARVTTRIGLGATLSTTFQTWPRSTC